MLCWVSNPSFEFFDHFPGLESSKFRLERLLKPQTCYVCLGWIHRLISPFTVDINMVYSWDMNGFFWWIWMVYSWLIPFRNPFRKKPFLYPRYPVHFIEEISQQNQHDVRGLRCRCSKDVAADSADVLGTWSRFGWKKLEDSQLDLKHPKSLGWRFFEVIMFMILIRFRYD